MFPDEIVVDTELGILLRWISLAGERPVERYELRDVVVGPPEPGAFRPDIPPGVRVAEESRDQPPSGPVKPWGLVACRRPRKPVRAAEVLGALRGEETLTYGKWRLRRHRLLACQGRGKRIGRSSPMSGGWRDG